MGIDDTLKKYLNEAYNAKRLYKELLKKGKVELDELYVEYTKNKRGRQYYSIRGNAKNNYGTKIVSFGNEDGAIENDAESKEDAAWQAIQIAINDDDFVSTSMRMG